MPRLATTPPSIFCPRQAFNCERIYLQHATAEGRAMIRTQTSPYSHSATTRSPRRTHDGIVRLHCIPSTCYRTTYWRLICTLHIVCELAGISLSQSVVSSRTFSKQLAFDKPPKYSFLTALEGIYRVDKDLRYAECFLWFPEILTSTDQATLSTSKTIERT